MSRNNNTEKVYSAGYRNAQKLKEKRYEGTITTEHVLSNPWFFKGVMGAVATTGTGPYTHTFSESDTVPSMTIENNIATESGDYIELQGAKINTCNITSAVNELVRVRLDMPYANETSSGTTTSKISESFDLFTFAHGAVELPSGTTLAQVQNIDLTITNTAEQIWGQGSRFAQECVVKNRDYTASVSMAFQQTSDLLEKFWGSSTGPADDIDEQATMKLKFTNGKTGTDERSISLDFTGVKPADDSLPQNPTETIMEDVSLDMRSLTVTAVNNTATSP